MKRYLIIALCFAAIAALATACGNRSKKAEAAEDEATAAKVAERAEKAKQDSLKMAQKVSELPEEPVFDIVTSMGTMRVKLYSKTPKHRDNFAKLAMSGFYNGILFHRVRPAQQGRIREAEMGHRRPGLHHPRRIHSRIQTQEGRPRSRPQGRRSQPDEGIFRLPVLYRT